MLHAAHSTEFALVVRWDRFAGAAVLPHILKTNDTVCDALQQFAEAGHSLDRCPFCEHYISRILRLLSLSKKGINPHEGERHIEALVTG